MLYVEDALKLIADRYWLTDGFRGLISSEWHSSFIQNVENHIINGKPLSTEQSRIVLKLISKVGHILAELGDVKKEEIENLISNPIHKQPPYSSANIKKEVRFLGGNFLGFRFKFNEMILSNFREMLILVDCPKPSFDRTTRIWVVPVSHTNIDNIKKIISKHRFEMDEHARNYLILVEASKDKKSTFEFDSESGLILGNVVDGMLAGWIKHVASGDWI